MGRIFLEDRLPTGPGLPLPIDKSQYKRTPAAACFDLDGTLIDTHSVKAVFSEQLARGGIGAKELIGLVT
jgi:hypothetical protein